MLGLVGSFPLVVPSSVGAAIAETTAAPLAADTSGAPVLLSQFDRAGYCDLAVSPDGTLHAVFNESPDASKPASLYYRASHDGGTTWSEPVNLSDDASANGCGYARVVVDGSGRVYAIWKYVAATELLDGPGGGARGLVAFRCLDGGNWSPITAIGDAGSVTYSWFASVGPDAAVHIVWSEMPADAIAAMHRPTWEYADLVQQVVLDGGRAGDATQVVPREPLPTRAEIDAAHTAGHDIPRARLSPRPNGLINLRGYIAATGEPVFIAEDHGTAADRAHGKHIVLWAGGALTPLHAYERRGTFNNFDNPPALLVDAQGTRHVIRAAGTEEAGRAAVRDFALDGTAPSATPVDVVAAAEKGSVVRWQATQLPRGRMAVCVALSEKGGHAPDDTELFVSSSDGAGVWSAPVRLTDNAERLNAFRKETGAGNAIGSVNSFSPRFAAVALDGEGRPCVLMVNSEDTIIGVANAGTDGHGNAVSVQGTARVDSPRVFFIKL